MKIRNTLTIGSLSVSPPLILAPMAGITDLPFRLLARGLGAPFCFSEMISAEGLKRNGKNTLSLLRSAPEDAPLGIQLFGDDSDSLAEAARMVEERCDLIDLNMGCPVKKVVAGGAGSSLPRNLIKAAAILRSLRKATRLPLTVKIRSGWNFSEQTFLEIGRIAQEEGCDAVTLHPRTRAQMFSEKAEWRKIKELKDCLTIPVIGSGDIFSGRDAVDMLSQTGCDGAMIARGAMGNPWIFRDASNILDGKAPFEPSMEERHGTTRIFLERLCDFYGEKAGVREIRKHLSWYVKGLPGAARFRALANTIENKQQLLDTVDDFFNRVN